jgi:hypothetical protein
MNGSYHYRDKGSVRLSAVICAGVLALYIGGFAICAFAMVGYGKVLVSMEGMRFTGDRAPSAVEYAPRGVLRSARDEVLAIEGFKVRNERRIVGGSYVSGPSGTDMKIVRLLLRNNIRSVEDYAEWLAGNITYRKDRGSDIWASPEEVLEKGWGDCEDFAFLNAAALRVFGYEPKVLAAGGLPGADSHAICVFRKGRYYAWLDNARLRVSAALTEEEFYDILLYTYNCAVILSVSIDDKDKYITAGSGIDWDTAERLAER